MFDVNKYNDIVDKIKYNEKQDNVYLNNNTFKILESLIDTGSIKKTHVSFTFTYLYLITYLFRYTKYSDKVLTTGEIKELLGYSKVNKRIDYIIKENGVLDTVGLTKTIHDFPIDHSITNGSLTITMLSELNNNDSYSINWRKQRGISISQSCKYPTLGFYNTLKDDIDISYFDNGGSFFNVNYTTLIPFKVLLYCLSNKAIGVDGFYTYCKILSFNKITNSHYHIGIVKLGNDIYFGTSKIQSIMNNLRLYGLISTDVIDAFYFGKYASDNKANGHFANDYNSFVKDDKTNIIVKPKYVRVDKQIDDYDNIAEILYL